MSRSAAWEVCILGGGPAGAAAALQLARLGHRVLAVEKEAFPRPHVGESLAPGIWPQLALLGLADAVRAAGFSPARAALVRWGGPAEVKEGSEDGLLVDRGRFDRLLLDAARAAGAQVLQPARALCPRPTADGWAVPVATGGREIEIAAGFLVDATGRASRLGGRKLPTARPTVALHAAWARPSGAWCETRVEAGAGEWFWGAPLPDGTYNAMAFLDTGRYRGRRRAGASRESLYRELLGRSVLLSDLLTGELPARIAACDATCRADPEPIGDRFLKLGEAAFAIDPLSASGVQVALRTAWSGSLAVHTLLTRPAQAAAARQFYAEAQESSVRRHAAWAAAYHAQAGRPGEGDGPHPAPGHEPLAHVPAAKLWDPERRVQLSAAAVVRETPCLVGDLIELRRGLLHPGLDRAVAFLDEIEVAPLLDAIPEAATLGRLAQAWSARIPARRAFAVAHWLLRHGVLVPA